MLRTTLLLALAALACQIVSSKDLISLAVASDAEQLTNSIILGDYDSAVTESKSLERRNKGRVISDVVDKLIDESQRKVMDYTYHLWTKGGQDLVKKYFPLQFRTIFGEFPVKLISKRDGLAMKLGKTIDSNGDRGAYGDSSDLTGSRIVWKFVYPNANSGVLYFKLYNVMYNQYLKLGTSSDSYGEYTAYGATQFDTDRHLWYLVPARYNGEVLFYIYNVNHKQALKLGRSVDSDGDRTVYSESGDVSGQPERFGWQVLPM